MNFDEMAAYDYQLPEDRIAQSPLEPRSSARLLDATSAVFADRSVSDLGSLCRSGDVVVVNDTRVLPARVDLFRHSGGRVEFLFLEEIAPTIWVALCSPSRKVSVGSTFFDSQNNPILEVTQRRESLGDSPVQVVVHLRDAQALESLGKVPLPPYIKVPLADSERYQTIFSRRASSAAAPTAGLHLDRSVIDSILASGARICRVELSVGLDTFLPIKTALIKDHVIHTESYSVDEDQWLEIIKAQRVLAIGTTVVRTLETAAATGVLKGRSSLFISGDYNFQVVDRLMTNFHIPRSSLLLLVDAFVGPIWREIYSYGLSNDYRFLSFGDAMLLERRG